MTQSPATTVEASQRPQPKSGLPRFFMIVVSLAALGLSLHYLKELASIVAPLFFGVNLMITVYPLYKWLANHKVPKWLSALLAGLVIFLVLVAFIAGLSWSVAAMVGKLPDYADQFNQLYAQGIELLTRFGLTEESLVKQIKGIDPKSVVGFATGILSGAQGFTTLVIVMLTAMIFMVMDTPDMQKRMDVAHRDHPRFIGALEQFCTGIRKYWVVTTVFGLIVAVLDFAVLVGLGVPLALVWGMFSFLTNYIPNVGFIIGLVPPALLALFESGPKTAIIVVIAYSVLNFVVQSIIQPRVAGDAVGLSPTLSFASLLLWAYVLGALGALLALPCSLLAKALLVDADPRARWANALISSRIEDVEEPEAVDLAAEPREERDDRVEEDDEDSDAAAGEAEDGGEQLPSRERVRD